MSSTIDRIITTALLIITVVMVAVFARREFFPSRAQAQAPSPATFVEGWNAVLLAGIRVGSADAPVTVVEFVDFECPFCRRADSVLASVQQRFGSDVALVFVHFPLPNHRFAMPGARSAECALDQGRFDQMRRLLFIKQDSLGLKSWVSYARDATVPDTSLFNACVQRTSEIARVADGRRLGQHFGVRGTPTIWVNGWRVSPAPDEIEAAVARAVAGQPIGTGTRPNQN